MLTQEFTNQLKSFTGFESRNDFMLYPSGMLVVRPANDGTGEIRYTKHYYAGAERVSSKIGTTTNLGSFLRDWTLMENSTEFPENPVINGKEQLRKAEQAVRRVYTAFGMNTTVTPGTDAFNPVFAFTHQSAEPDQYYYHPDHLGSSNYITNAEGLVNQHIEYFAFGESFVDEHLNSYNSPYKFNSKELDEETGWYYYGARYYDPRVSLWLSVDPLAEKYSNISPFAYCANNPIMLVDPDGRNFGDYFTLTGQYLGSDGIDDGQIYIDGYNINSDVKIPWWVNRNELIKGAAIGISNYYYKKSGGNISQLQKGSIVSGAAGLASTAFGEQYKLQKNKAEVKINTNEIGIKSKNSYDFINLFKHERNHISKFINKLSNNSEFEYTEKNNFWEFEKSATRKQVFDESWSKTSQEFKQYIYNSYGKYEWVFTYPEQEKYFGTYGIKIDYWTGSYELQKVEEEFMK